MAFNYNGICINIYYQRSVAYIKAYRKWYPASLSALKYNRQANHIISGTTIPAVCDNAPHTAGVNGDGEKYILEEI